MKRPLFLFTVKKSPKEILSWILVFLIAFPLLAVQLFRLLFQHSRKSFGALVSRQVLALWMKKSSSLLLSTLIYNVVVIAVIRPLLRMFFPPLSPWENVKHFVGGSSRLTYNELLPYFGPAFWILGNGLLFALLNRNLKEAQESIETKREQDAG